MKKRILGILLILALSVGLFGCSAKMANDYVPENYSTQNSSGAYVNPETATTTDGTKDSGIKGQPLSEADGETDSDRKIITTIDYDLETKTFSETMDQLNKLVLDSGGYVESSRENTGRNNNVRYAQYTFRIPVGAIAGFCMDLEGLCNVLNKAQTGKDVTLQYYDHESQLESLRIQQARVLEILEKANTLSEILTIENELNRIRTEIERLTTTLTRLDDLVDYATINVSLSEVEAYAKPAENFWEKLGETVINSLNAALSFLKGLCIGLVWALPYLIIIGIVLFVIFFFIRRKKKKRTQEFGETVSSKIDDMTNKE